MFLMFPQTSSEGGQERTDLGAGFENVAAYRRLVTAVCLRFVEKNVALDGRLTRSGIGAAAKFQREWGTLCRLKMMPG